MHSRFKGILFQDFFPLHGAVEINSAAGTRTLAQRAPIFTHFITGPPGELKGGTGIFFVASENIPARGEDHQVAQASQGEAPIMDQAIDLVDLGHVKIGIEPVVGVLLPQGFDKPFFFIFANALLGEVDQSRDLVDQEEISAVSSTTDIFSFSSGHNSVYKKRSINKFYIERLFIQGKSLWGGIGDGAVRLTTAHQSGLFP
jgi:hypothetical protein